MAHLALLGPFQAALDSEPAEGLGSNRLRAMDLLEAKALLEQLQ